MELGYAEDTAQQVATALLNDDWDTRPPPAPLLAPSDLAVVPTTTEELEAKLRAQAQAQAMAMPQPPYMPGPGMMPGQMPHMPMHMPPVPQPPYVGDYNNLMTRSDKVSVWELFGFYWVLGGYLYGL